MREIQTVGVVGAGVMGIGVSQNLAQTGHQVILVDVSEDILNHAKQEIRNNVRFQGFFQKNSEAESPDDILNKIKFSTNYKFLEDAEFVVENVTEKWDLKKEVYAQLDAICPEKTAFAANTSAISITRIASVTKRATRVVGMHFMNPVPMKPMVEMIRGHHTSDETIETAKKNVGSDGQRMHHS